jgi:hypothetical protein
MRLWRARVLGAAWALVLAAIASGHLEYTGPAFWLASTALAAATGLCVWAAVMSGG